MKKPESSLNDELDAVLEEAKRNELEMQEWLEDLTKRGEEFEKLNKLLPSSMELIIYIHSLAVKIYGKIWQNLEDSEKTFVWGQAKLLKPNNFEIAKQEKKNIKLS